MKKNRKNRRSKNKEKNRSDQVRLTEDFLRKLKITTDIPMRHMTLNNHESCAARFISGMLKAKGNYQWSEDAFEEAIRLYPKFTHSIH